AQRARDRLLTDDVIEPLRAPLAGEDQVRHGGSGESWVPPRPGAPAAHLRDYLALLPSGPDAVRRLKLHRVRAAVRPTRREACVPSDQRISVPPHAQGGNRRPNTCATSGSG